MTDSYLQADSVSSAIYIYDGRGTNAPLHVLTTHVAPVTSIQYNPISKVAISADEKGMIEYWDCEEVLWFLFKIRVSNIARRGFVDNHVVISHHIRTLACCFGCPWAAGSALRPAVCASPRPRHHGLVGRRQPYQPLIDDAAAPVSRPQNRDPKTTPNPHQGYDAYEFPTKKVSFEFPSDTDLFDFVKQKPKAIPWGLSISPDGKKFASMASDRKVRLFSFTTGKLLRVYDESETAQETGGQFDIMELKRNMAGERDLMKSAAIRMAIRHYFELVLTHLSAMYHPTRAV